MRKATIRKISGIGKAYTAVIVEWQKRAQFSHDIDVVGEMIQEDALRILELRDKIQALEEKMEVVAQGSEIVQMLSTIPGFGPICTAELAGEIGTIERFGGEASLALYVGMANLDNSSGKQKASRPPTQVNTRAKAAMMVAVDRHRKQVPQSQRYYEKKRSEGKKHNQTIRALGRHLCRIIFKMLRDNREYVIQ